MLAIHVDREIQLSIGLLLFYKILLLKPSFFITAFDESDHPLSVGSVKLNDNIPLVKIQEIVFVQELCNGIGGVYLLPFLLKVLSGTALLVSS